MNEPNARKQASLPARTYRRKTNTPLDESWPMPTQTRRLPQHAKEQTCHDMCQRTARSRPAKGSPCLDQCFFVCVLARSWQAKKHGGERVWWRAVTLLFPTVCSSYYTIAYSLKKNCFAVAACERSLLAKDRGVDGHGLCFVVLCLDLYTAPLGHISQPAGFPSQFSHMRLSSSPLPPLPPTSKRLQRRHDESKHPCHPTKKGGGTLVRRMCF